MAVAHRTYDELSGMVDSNDYQTAQIVAGALTLVPIDVADQVTSSCLILRFEDDGAYVPASVLAGRSIISFSSDFLQKHKNSPTMQTEAILLQIANHILGHQKGWERKDQGEDEAAHALVRQWLAEWATP